MPPPLHQQNGAFFFAQKRSRSRSPEGNATLK